MAKTRDKPEEFFSGRIEKAGNAIKCGLRQLPSGINCFIPPVGIITVIALPIAVSSITVPPNNRYRYYKLELFIHYKVYYCFILHFDAALVIKSYFFICTCRNIYYYVPFPIILEFRYSFFFIEVSTTINYSLARPDFFPLDAPR